MRATGFGQISPFQHTGEYRHPQRDKNGGNLDFNYKSLSHKRREMLYIQKNGLDELINADGENQIENINYNPNRKLGTIRSNRSQVGFRKQQVKDIVGRQFSTFGKESRFAYVEQEQNRMNKETGPGSYNSNPFLNIESTVNSSHHVFGIPLIGLAKGNKDEAFTCVNGVQYFDERFATLKYKKQQLRTTKEAGRLQGESIDSREKRARVRTTNGQRNDCNEPQGTIQDMRLDDNPNIEEGFVRARIMSQSPSRMTRSKTPQRYQHFKQSLPDVRQSKNVPYQTYGQGQMQSKNHRFSKSGPNFNRKSGNFKRIQVKEGQENENYNQNAFNIQDNLQMNQNIANAPNNIHGQQHNDDQPINAVGLLNENSQDQLQNYNYEPQHHEEENGNPLQNEIRALKLQSNAMSKKTERELQKIQRKILQMKVQNWQTNINSPAHRMHQITAAPGKRSKRQTRMRNQTGAYTSGGLTYQAGTNNYLAQYKQDKNPYLMNNKIQ